MVNDRAFFECCQNNKLRINSFAMLLKNLKKIKLEQDKIKLKDAEMQLVALKPSKGGVRDARHAVCIWL